MPSASYLQPLVAPLRFLAQSDFARLSSVKGLDALVRAAREGARAARASGDVQLLERVARALASGSPEAQQEALRAVAPRVRESGLGSPPPATAAGPSVAATPAAAPPAHPAPAAPPRPPAPAASKVRPADAPPAALPAPPAPAAPRTSAPAVTKGRTPEARPDPPPPAARPVLYVEAPTTHKTGRPPPSTGRAPRREAPPGLASAPGPLENAERPAKRTASRPSPALLEEPRAPRRRTRRPRPPKPEAEEVARPIAAVPSRGPLSQPIGGPGIRVPPRLVEALNKKGLQRVGDLLFLLPRTYEDRRRLSTLRELRPGEKGVAVGTVRMARELMIRPGKRGFQAVLADDTGSIALTWFQSGPWMKSRVPVGKRLIVSGELRATPGGREMVH
ncbi:MAG: OB-fold nucleic acid binding domain-containing protein, partial [Myxococcaceae bacterium]